MPGCQDAEVPEELEIVESMEPQKMQATERQGHAMELDRSKKTEKKAMEPREVPSDDEPGQKKEKTARLAAKSVKGSVNESETAQAVPTFTEVAQLKEALASCVQQMERMQKDFVARNQSAQPDTTVYQLGQYGVPPIYGQPAPASVNSNPP